MRPTSTTVPATTLVTTGDGCRATLRSVRWSPVLATPVAASVAVVAASALVGPAGDMTLAGDVALAFTAVAGAFLLDDPTAAAAPATPIGARARLLARAAVALPVAVAGWLVVLAVYRRVGASAAAGVADRAPSALGLASAAVGFGALGASLGFDRSPGAAGAAVMAGGGALTRACPAGWLEALPSGDALGLAAIPFALVAVAAATREPAR